MKLIITLMSLSFFSACGQTPTKIPISDKKITRNISEDINTILPTGEFVVDIMDEVTISPRRQELQTKFTEGMKANPEWYLQQRKIAEETGKGIAYDTRIGMNEQEWEEYKKMSTNTSDMQAISTGTAKVLITKINDTISFKAEGKLSFLNATTINLKDSTVNIFDYKLMLIDTVNVSRAENIFKSAWRGYKWQFSQKSSNKMPMTQEELANFSMKLYGLTLGIFEKTKKSYIEVSGAERIGGKQNVKYRIPIVF